MQTHLHLNCRRSAQNFKPNLTSFREVESLFLQSKSNYYEHSGKTGKLLATQLHGLRAKQLIAGVHIRWCTAQSPRERLLQGAVKEAPTNLENKYWKILLWSWNSKPPIHLFWCAKDIMGFFIPVYMCGFGVGFWLSPSGSPFGDTVDYRARPTMSFLSPFDHMSFVKIT